MNTIQKVGLWIMLALAWSVFVSMAIKFLGGGAETSALLGFVFGSGLGLFLLGDKRGKKNER